MMHLHGRDELASIDDAGKLIKSNPEHDRFSVTSNLDVFLLPPYIPDWFMMRLRNLMCVLVVHDVVVDYQPGKTHETPIPARPLRYGRKLQL